VAPPAGTLRVGRYFLALVAIFVVLYTIVFWPGQRHTPKLGLDLEGGAQVIFRARTPDGSTPSASSMNEARNIMEQRVNGSGVAEAEVIIQGNNEIVVSIPGKTTADIKDLGAAAKLNFRPVVMPPVSAAPSTPAATTSGSATPSASATAQSSSGSSHSAQAANARPLAAGTPTASGHATSTPSAHATTPTPSASPAPAKTSDPLKGLPFPIPASQAEYDKLTAAEQQQLQTAMANFQCGSKPPDIETKPLLACDESGLVYLLGPVIVPGTEIDTAAAVAPNASSGQFDWRVSLTLKSSGQGKWAAYTSAHHSNTGGNIPAVTSCSTSTTPCAEYVAFTLDGTVISAPHNEAAINGQATEISGSFTQQSAETLAQQLKYGALPLNFEPLTSQNVSASLGTSQLKAGLLAGGIGLALVVIYSLIYYRALGLVTIASLLVSGGLTYACLVILGRQIGFTLTLAGIAGFIVAIGITADSFVVFFERIKDEVHEGRSVRTAVPRAWVRARRTILSADTVSFLAAAVLFYFAAGDVKGFAFTLGLSTILDLVVVFLFTHPVVSLLSRSRTFGSARFTGLNAVREGGVATEALPPPAPVHRARPPRAKPAAGASSVAVLDRADVDTTAGSEPAVAPAPPAVAPTVTQPPPSATAEPPVAPSSSQESPPRAGGPVVPEPGTAAERAAARRARLRAEAGKKGDS
jgi:preprotein translocase subunit SecD